MRQKAGVAVSVGIVVALLIVGSLMWLNRSILGLLLRRVAREATSS